MRYLNKIVFINSANIKYAEINLDGNVHFIGTQGVGKSTILRAILFFYNANKQKLGIRTQQGQKPFDEFYLPNPNSYILYEVVRENGKFFIIAFRSQGRTAFRFVDCPYERHFFIDADGNAEYEWGKISQNIGMRVFKSNIIRTQQQYLDILYGNSQSVSRELRRFSIMESARYQNVPRTIQNIFLNQSLESQVIKDIIIDSMDFADRNNIDLNQIRTEVKDFRMQYDDISKWYRKDKNGTVKVRNEVDRVLNTYSIYEECRRLSEQQKQMQSAIHDTEGFMASESWPREFAENNIIETVKVLSEILSDLKNRVMTLSRNRDSFINAVKQFKANFTPQNTFHFATEFNTESDYANFAANLSEFIGNDMIESYRQRVSDHYARILRTIGIETGNLMSNRSQVQATVNEINRDFRENNFVGVVKEIELRISDSSDRLVQHLLVIKKFNDEHGDSIGEMDLFTDESQRTQNNHRAVDLLTMLMDELDADQKRDHVTLADVFKLEFRVRENDNDTGWVERLSNVGSDGTDILVKAMVNIMLINVFKKKVSKRFGDLDLAGIRVFITEFYRYLGERSSFLISPDYEERIKNGSRKRYDAQLTTTKNMIINNPRLRALAACIHKYHRGYDQEGYIRTRQQF